MGRGSRSLISAMVRVDQAGYLSGIHEIQTETTSPF